MNATTYAVDTAKNVMQLHWVEAGSGEIGRRKLSRAKFVEFFSTLPPPPSPWKPAGGAPAGARSVGAMGTGRAAARAPGAQLRARQQGRCGRCASDLAGRPAKRHPPCGREERQHQAVLSAHRLRAHWVSVRTASVNALRGLLYEFGVVLPAGKVLGLKVLAARRAEFDERLPALMRRLVDQQLAALRLEQEVTRIEAELKVVQKNDANARRLRKVPGIGLLGATALAAVLGNASGWRSAREFACALGLTPRHRGTGGKVTMGAINKRGDPVLCARCWSVGRARSPMDPMRPSGCAGSCSAAQSTWRWWRWPTSWRERPGRCWRISATLIASGCPSHHALPQPELSIIDHGRTAPPACARGVEQVMAKRSRPWVGKAVALLGELRAEPADEMSPNLATDHQGQQSSLQGPGLHPKAGYETAVDPPRQNLQTSLATREALHIRSAASGSARVARFVN